MNKAAILHKAGQNFAFPIDKNTLKIRLKAAKSDLEEAKIIYGSRYPLDHQDPYLIKSMEHVASDELYDYFEVSITMEDSRFRYYFYLSDGEDWIWYSEKGFTDIRPQGVWGFGEYFQYPIINENDIFDVPGWVQDAVFYQIFPERFYNGNLGNDPTNTGKWGDKPQRDSFYGGDLQGIIDKLDYISELGINAIYLTPIFASTSNHKYNIDDYYSIDPNFGDITTARKMVEEAHRRGIKVILDAVFNHSGYNFFAFKDLREHGESSEYKDWYFIDKFPVKTSSPVNYNTFANDIKNMPRLNTSNPEFQSYLLQVAEYWIEEIDIDGWRLDVADEVDHQFWVKFREQVRNLKEDIYIVGENWHNSEDWLQGDQFDAIMNYPLGMAILDFFAYNKIGPVEFNNRLMKNWMLYQDCVNYSMLNLLDSHDTARLINFFSGNKELMKLAIMFQFTYPGAPMIYYGDEVGMEGEGDPDCRRCMIWDEDKQDQGLYTYYQKLIDLRHKRISLRHGNYKAILIDQIKNIYGFSRGYDDERTIVIFNNGAQDYQYKIDANLFESEKEIYEHITGIRYELEDKVYSVNIPGYTGIILSQKT